MADKKKEPSKARTYRVVKRAKQVKHPVGDGKNGGFYLSEMIDFIGKESQASDVSAKDRYNLCFLFGFLKGISASKDDKTTNLSSAVEICHRIKLKHAKPATNKMN